FSCSTIWPNSKTLLSGTQYLPERGACESSCRLVPKGALRLSQKSVREQSAISPDIESKETRGSDPSAVTNSSCSQLRRGVEQLLRVRDSLGAALTGHVLW